MKKIICLVLSILMLISLCACGEKKSEEAKPAEPETVEEEVEAEEPVEEPEEELEPEPEEPAEPEPEIIEVELTVDNFFDYFELKEGISDFNDSDSGTYTNWSFYYALREGYSFAERVQIFEIESSFVHTVGTPKNIDFAAFTWDTAKTLTSAKDSVVITQDDIRERHLYSSIDDVADRNYSETFIGLPIVTSIVCYSKSMDYYYFYADSDIELARAEGTVYLIISE